MMRWCGYSKLSKFKEHRKEWDAVHRKMPLSYLDYVGVEREVLHFALEVDFEEYGRAREIPLYPKFAVIRLMAGVYREKGLPENTPESEAIEMLRGFSRERNLRCCINYPELKTVYIEPTGDVRVVYYPPSIRFSKKWAIPASDGIGIGAAYAG